MATAGTVVTLITLVALFMVTMVPLLRRQGYRGHHCYTNQLVCFVYGYNGTLVKRTIFVNSECLPSSA